MLAVSAAVNAWEKPEFCGEHSCPSYTTIFENKDYTLRCYDGFMTATTNVGDVSPKQPDYKRAFMRLLRYISGYNDQEMKMEMTVPVLLSAMYNQVDKSFVSNMSFYINVKTPTTPTDENVRLNKVERFCVYVKSFLANVQANPGVIMERQTRELYKELAEHNQIIMAPGFSLYAGYHMPGSTGYHEVSVKAPRLPLFYEMWRKEGISKRCYVAMDKDSYAMIDIKVKNPKSEDYAAVFEKLESYMSGMNALKITLERGNPFIIDTRVDESGNRIQRAFYYLPGSAPTPLDEDITIVKSPGYCVYVKSFKGVMVNTELIQKETIILKKFMAKWKIQTVPNKYFYASYGMTKNQEVWMAHEYY